MQLTIIYSLASVDVEAESEDDDGEDSEKDESVEEDGLAVGPQAAELHAAVRPRELEQQARRQQHEQHHPHHHRSPVSHPISTNPTLDLISKSKREERRRRKGILQGI